MRPKQILLKLSDEPAAILVWKEPDHKASHYRLLWRRGEADVVSRRDLLGTDGCFWNMSLETARGLLSLAQANGLLSQKWQRWNSCQLHTYFSNGMEHGFAANFLTDHVSDCVWRRPSGVRIVSCREPSPSRWWKVLLISDESQIVGVRSVLEPPVPSDQPGYRSLSGWAVYPILMDADVATHRIHLSELLKYG